MGGNVAWTIRKADGTEFRMDRWTNIFNGGLTSVVTDAFLAGDADAFDEATKTWLEWKADWEANKDTGKFSLEATDVYAPYPFGLRPSEYGFIVTDFVSKTIVSCQNYTSFGQTHVIPRHLKEGYEPEKLKMVEDLAHQGRLISYLDEKTHVLKPFPVNPEEALDFIMSQDFVLLKFSYRDGWKAEEHDSDTEEGRRAAYDRVLALGFALDDEEKADFEGWIASRKRKRRR